MKRLKYSFMDLAKSVLEESAIPLSVSEIWNMAERKGFVAKLKSSGKTPEKTLAARLYVDIRDNDKSIFCQVSKRPAKFFLTSKKEKAVLLTEEYDIPDKKLTFNERDLHKLLSSFVQADAHFKCRTKTIYHEKSKKEPQGKNKWLHPDMVGVYYPFVDFSIQSLNLFSVMGESSYKLFSFEMKKQLNYGNLRQNFFQAVSNSSWANEGYLVALEIDEDEGFLEELRRLNNAFGIGIIKLNPFNISQSEILFAAQEHKSLDWVMIERLVDENGDFKTFIEDVVADATNDDKRLRGKYDDYFKDDEEAESYALECGLILKKIE